MNFVTTDLTSVERARAVWIMNNWQIISDAAVAEFKQMMIDKLLCKATKHDYSALSFKLGPTGLYNLDPYYSTAALAGLPVDDGTRSTKARDMVITANDKIYGVLSVDTKSGDGPSWARLAEY
jgi:hypothetical protein